MYSLYDTISVAIIEDHNSGGNNIAAFYNELHLQGYMLGRIEPINNTPTMAWSGDLMALLVYKQRVYIPSAIEYLESRSRVSLKAHEVIKDGQSAGSHWMWWVFPCSRGGNSEQTPVTSIGKHLVPKYCELARVKYDDNNSKSLSVIDIWTYCLQQIIDLSNQHRSIYKVIGCSHLPSHHTKIAGKRSAGCSGVADRSRMKESIRFWNTVAEDEQETDPQKKIPDKLKKAFAELNQLVQAADRGN